MISEDHVVLCKVRELAEKISSLEEVKRFQLAEKQLNTSNSVRNLIQQIKQKQKELVHAKHYKKYEYVRLLEKEVDSLQNQFDNLPIVREYQQNQVEVNNVLQLVQRNLFAIMENKFSVEISEKTSGGCSSKGFC